MPDDLARAGRAAGRSGAVGADRGAVGAGAGRGGPSSGRGRPTIAMETYVRLMVVKHRSGWGYETLMREVSDSIHLRRFCRIGLTERVPDESTVRKLTRRLGAEVVHEITREVIQKARREKRFRPRAARIDSTVIEADVRCPTDAGLAADGVRALAREGRKLATQGRREAHRGPGSLAGDGSQAPRVDAHDPPAHRGGQARGARADRADRASCCERSVKEARKLAPTARQRARGRGAQAKLKAARGWRSSRTAARRSTAQITQRVDGRADQGPAHLAVGSGRPADPQGQARQTERIRVRRSALRDHRQHQARRARVHPAARHPDRQPGREHAAA